MIGRADHVSGDAEGVRSGSGREGTLQRQRITREERTTGFTAKGRTEIEIEEWRKG